MKIIAFTGKQGSGKTETTQLIKPVLESKGYRVIVVKFADPIYRIMNSLCDVVHLDFDKPKMRPIMQFVGEHMRKEYGSNFWVDKWEMEIKHAEMFSVGQPDAIYLCDDLRYPNEADKVRSLGGAVVEVSTEDSIRKERIQVVGAEHSSEKGINRPVDYTLYNNTTKEDLAQRVNELAESLIVRFNQR